MNPLNPKWLRRWAYTCPQCNHDYSILELSWLGSSHGKKDSSSLNKDISLDVIFLSETKIPIRKCNSFLMSLGFDNLDFVNPRGKKGGLVVSWKNGVDIEITYKYCNMINGLVFSDPLNEP